jgi:glycosyltransferase involved in cell wall biosynthesis
MNQSVSLPAAGELPKRLLYATSARVGGIGLDLVAEQQLQASWRGGFLKRAVAYRNRSAVIPEAPVRSLRFHPVRLISFLDRPYYYGAKRRYADWIASREVRTGGYDFFHGWSGDSLLALRAAGEQGIPSVLDIPTWHCAHGFRSYENVPPAGGLSGCLLPRKWLDSLPIRPGRLREEYERATLLLTRSTYATETFLREGFPPEKICNTDDGADIERFQPGEPPPIFRALFVGALIRRKGVHLLLEAWRRLNLKDAELVLAGFVHEEIRPYLEKYGGPSVRVTGKTKRVEDHYRAATVHVFPSLCEGCAKTTCEAAACGLPQISTREAGDVVQDGYNGIIIPPDNVDALCAALERLHRCPELLGPMRLAARARAVDHFSWDKYRARLLGAYRQAQALGGGSGS